MAKITWRGGRDVSVIARDMRVSADSIKAEANEALLASAEKGAVKLQDYLEAATTPTGERRVAAGGISAGRHDTGTMVGAVNYSDRVRRQGTVSFAQWGWFADVFQQYFRDQDEGAGKIPAARALFNSFVFAREDFRQRMRRVVKGKAQQ